MADQVIAIPAEPQYSNDSHVVVGAAADTLLIAAKPGRATIIITNDGAADAQISYGTAAATSTDGELLKPGGEIETNWPGMIRAYSTTGTTIGFVEKLWSNWTDADLTGSGHFFPAGPSDTAIPAPTAPLPGVPIPHQY